MGKFNRVNGTVGSIPVIFHYFQDSGTTKSLEDLGGFVADPLLGKRTPCWAKWRQWPKNLRNPIGRAIKSFLLLPNQTRGFSLSIIRALYHFRYNWGKGSCSF